MSSVSDFIFQIKPSFKFQFNINDYTLNRWWD